MRFGKKMAADDAGMDTTCPSPEIPDSRKRPLDADSDNGSTKRSHFSGEFLKKKTRIKSNSGNLSVIICRFVLEKKEQLKTNS